MSYRDLLMQQMKETGEWERLTSERRNEIERFIDDDVARAILVASDIGDAEVNDSFARLMSSDTEQRDAEAWRVAEKMVTNLAEVFNGRLIDVNRFLEAKQFRLSPLGEALGEFFLRAEESGIALYDTLDQLSQISRNAATSIKFLAKKERRGDS